MKEIVLKLTAKTTAGIRTIHFSNAVLFLTGILKLEIADHDQEKEIAQFKLPSGEGMEVYGSKNLWRPCTTPLDWGLIIADLRYMKEKS